MKKIETLFTGAVLIAAITVAAGAIWSVVPRNTQKSAKSAQYETKYGAFLAAQHAIYVNDFNRAAEFARVLEPLDYPVVQNTKMISEFLSGNLPRDVELLNTEKTAPAMMMYDAYLVQKDSWDELYKRHKSDESALTAPLRIWASVANGKSDEAIKFLDKLPVADSWRAFVRGQIYAEQGDTARAASEFANVRTDFLNLNDYLYVMSFYTHNGMVDAADALRSDFTGRPGGMFMLDYDAIPDWSQYAGKKNALAFSLVQNVSHTQIMMYSDLAILMLRQAQIIAPDMGADTDAIQYYLGQYFFNNNGDYAQYFNRIRVTSPFYPFAILRGAEKNDDVRAIKRVLNEYPLFVPAVNSIIGHHIKNGNRRDALRVVNAALNDERLNDISHAFFLKSRAQINYAFGEYKDAASDLHAAADILTADAEILSLQAKIWAAENREIENAYEYAMTLVQRAPSDILAWDTLGRVVAVREGVDAALDVLMRVGQIANSCSSLFDQLGDLFAAKGDVAAARDAYLRAIELSDDGLTVVPNVKKKLRKLK